MVMTVLLIAARPSPDKRRFGDKCYYDHKSGISNVWSQTQSPHAGESMQLKEPVQFALSESRIGVSSALLFHCFFNSDGSITHHMHDPDDDLVSCLPNLYVVYISDNALKRKRIVAGFFVKTSCTHLDFDFVEKREGDAIL